MILFLDFDGVLHPDAAYLEKGRPVLRADGELFMWTPHLIEALAPYPNVQIVLSTSWVRVRGFTRARNALPKPLSERVIGATWHSAMRYGGWEDGGMYCRGISSVTRYEEIARYVLRAQIENWVAVDDDGEGWAESAKDKLIHTHPDKGIADPTTLTLLREKLEC